MMVVGIAMIGSLTVLPAMLSKLGDRVEKGHIPFLHRLRKESGDNRFWKAVLTPALRHPGSPPPRRDRAARDGTPGAQPAHRAERARRAAEQRADGSDDQKDREGVLERQRRRVRGRDQRANIDAPATQQAIAGARRQGRRGRCSNTSAIDVANQRGAHGRLASRSRSSARARDSESNGRARQAAQRDPPVDGRQGLRRRMGRSPARPSTRRTTELAAEEERLRSSSASSSSSRSCCCWSPSARS